MSEQELGLSEQREASVDGQSGAPSERGDDPNPDELGTQALGMSQGQKGRIRVKHHREMKAQQMELFQEGLLNLQEWNQSLD